MNYHDMTREELIAELLKLQRENRDLKVSLEKNTGGMIIREIPERKLWKKKQTENAENFSKEHRMLKSLIESPVDIIIFSLDKNYCYTAFTRHHKETIKKLWNVDIGVGMSILEVISNAVDREKAKKNFDRALQGDYFVVNEDYGDKSLTRRFYDDYYSPVRDSADNIIGLSVFVIDVTRLNKALEALNETNSYLENLFNYANAPIIVWDPQFRITRFNHAFENLTGRKEAEVIGKSIELLFPPALVENSMKLIRKTQTGERWKTVEIEILHCDQSSRIVLWNSATLFSNDGKTPISTIAQGQDITKRVKAENAVRQSEEKFRSLYDNMTEGSALHTLIYNDQGVPVDYRIMEVNPAFEAQLGISRDTVINKTSKAAYGVDNSPYFDIYSRVALTGKPETFETYFAPLDKHFSISVYRPTKDSFATIFENITERKKAEQAHSIILTKYQVLFEILPIGITISDTTGKIIESNKIAETILGISLEEQEKRRIDGQEWRIIRPDGSLMPASEFASVRALKEGRQVSNMELGIVKDNNQVTWLNVSATPVPVEGYGVAIVYNDVTEHRQAENEKERTQNLLEDSQRIGKIGGWEFNIDNQELKWTKEMYNIHEVDLHFKPVVDQRASFYTPESLPVVDNAIQNAIEQGGSYEIDSEIITAKGNLRSVRSIGKADLENRRVFGLFQDITERKKTEEELRKANAYLENLINYANAPIIVWDSQFRITRFNHAFEFITGLHEANILGKSLEILFPPELTKNSMALISKTLTGERWETVEIQIQHCDKSIKTLLWNSATLFMPDGKTPIATIAQGLDITERKQFEKELQASEVKLRELNATKDKFFSIIAHDLKSPFNGILGLSGMLKDEARDLTIDSIVKYSDIINSSAQQTFALLENLLDWAKTQQDGFLFDLKKILINNLIKNEIEGLKYTADQKNISLVNKTNKEIIITADEKMIATVLRNLISNAIKFTPKNGLVTVEAIIKIEQVEISISDTGVGMDKETIEKLFKIETSSTSRGTENEKGSGLGLLLCKEFVEKHRGTIWVESEKGKGSRFILSIPTKV